MFTNIGYVQIEELVGIFYVKSLPPKGKIIQTGKSMFFFCGILAFEIKTPVFKSPSTIAFILTKISQSISCESKAGNTAYH